jgi:polyisoprenoid-binding protein YceI
MSANLRGEFSGVAGTILFDPQNPAYSKVEAEIDAASIVIILETSTAMGT